MEDENLFNELHIAYVHIAYDRGWHDGYNDKMANNPYDKETQFEFWTEYNLGYEQGERDC